MAADRWDSLRHRVQLGMPWMTAKRDDVRDLLAEMDRLGSILQEMWNDGLGPYSKGLWIESFWDGDADALALAALLEPEDDL